MAKKAQRTQFSEGGGRAFPGISGHFLWFIWSSYGLKNILGGVVKKNSDRTHLSPHPNYDFGLKVEERASVKLVTIKISHCYNVYRKGCNSYKQCVVSILLQHVFVVTILLQHIILVTMRIGCNNVKIKYLLLQRLRNVVTQIFVATMNGICCNWQIFGRDLFDIYLVGGHSS